MTKKQKLELTWIGKDHRPKLEPRILLEDDTKTYHAKHRITENDIFDNKLIFGDNLLALKALEQEYAGKIKCVYIDPPYNTGSAFESYEDGLEHSIWLSLMRERLDILWRLLSPKNGAILISINDDECHYLKVLCDELFGRDKFVASLVWNYEGNTDNQAKIINYHEYVLVYSKTGQIDHPEVIDPNVSEESKLYKDEIRNTIVKNGPKNPPKSVKIPAGFPSNIEQTLIKREAVEWPQYNSDIKIDNFFTKSEVTATTGWSSRAILEDFINNGFQPVPDSKGQMTRFEMTRTGAIEAIKVREQKKGHFVSVLRGFGTTNQMRIMLSKLGIRFTYPKPVDLIAYLIEAFSGPEDIILDSFAGSGTTAHAVLKLNKEKASKRKFILVEINQETVDEAIIPRLKAVISGNRDAEISECGGGFRYYSLAPSLITFDKYNQPVINKGYNPVMLSQAMCKLMGFTYAPSDTVYWQQGHSTETDFIYVTTQTLDQGQLSALSEEAGENRTLLICCAAFRGNADKFENLTVKKIPRAVLDKCEWDKDDYSLNVQNLPMLEPEPATDIPTVRAKRAAKQAATELPLFADKKRK
jgi:adenine-specific DNA-methyltransferase